MWARGGSSLHHRQRRPIYWLGMFRFFSTDRDRRPNGRQGSPTRLHFLGQAVEEVVLEVLDVDVVPAGVHLSWVQGWMVAERWRQKMKVFLHLHAISSVSDRFLREMHAC